MATITRGNISEMTIMYHNVVTYHALIKPKEHEQITNDACSLKPVSCLCLLLRTLRHLCLDSSWNDMMVHKSYQTNCFLQSIFFPAFCYYFSIPLKINISFMDMIILLVLFCEGWVWETHLLCWTKQTGYTTAIFWFSELSRTHQLYAMVESSWFAPVNKSQFLKFSLFGELGKVQPRTMGLCCIIVTLQASGSYCNPNAAHCLSPVLPNAVGIGPWLGSSEENLCRLAYW